MAATGISTAVSLPDPKPECQTGLSDLPKSCILAIFIFFCTTPRDICTLSLVSKLCKSVAYSDDLWNKFLPKESHEIIRKADPLVPASKRELYVSLRDSILIDGGKMRAWLDRSTAKMVYMLSARALTIIWSHDEQYWCFVPGDGHQSRFQELAKLLKVYWLEVRGRIDCRLLSPSTNYRVVFVLKFTEDHYGWQVPIKFSVATPDGEQMELEQCLESRDETHFTARAAADDGGWMEVVGGEFTARAAADDDDDYDIEFSMKEVEHLYLKCGILIDGVRIQPSRVCVGV